MYTPLNWHKINVSEGTYIPSTRKVMNNKTFDFWERALFHRALYSIKCNIPWEGMTKDFFYWVLFRRGYVAVFDDKELGLSFMNCTPKGYNFYYQPTSVIIANPYWNRSKELEIGKDCEILKLTPDWLGIWDIIYYYAEKLAELSLSIDMSIVNNRLAYVLGAKTKAAAQALKKIFDKINSGETTIIYDQRIFNDENEEPWQFIERNALKQNYLTDNMLQDFHTLINMFDKEIGIPTIPYEKKERMIEDEANSTIIDSTSRITVWLETLNESAKVINNHYGTNITFEARYKPQTQAQKEGDQDVNS